MNKWFESYKKVISSAKTNAPEGGVRPVQLGNFCSFVYDKLTPSLLVVFTLVVFYPFYIKGPISCLWASPAGRDSSTSEEFIDRYCFTLATYSISDNSSERDLPQIYPGVGPELGDSKRKYHRYYQFVPYLLLFKCLVFRLPYYFWANGGHQERGLIAYLAAYLDEDVEKNIDRPDHATRMDKKQTAHCFEPNKHSTHIVHKPGGSDGCQDELNHERPESQWLADGDTSHIAASTGESSMNPERQTSRDGREEEKSMHMIAKEKVERVADYFYKRQNHFLLMTVFWFVCDLLALGATGVIFYITDVLLDGSFATYGLFEFSNNGVKNELFPTMTKCRLHKYGVSASIENRDILCVLSMNIYYSYIFLILWWWYIFIAALALASLMYKSYKLWQLKYGSEKLSMETRGSISVSKNRELTRCMSSMPLSGIVFFYLLSMNLGPHTYKAFVAELAGNSMSSRKCGTGDT